MAADGRVVSRCKAVSKLDVSRLHIHCGRAAPLQSAGDDYSHGAARRWPDSSAVSKRETTPYVLKLAQLYEAYNDILDAVLPVHAQWY